MQEIYSLYLNAAVEDMHADQRKLFGLLDSLTKEQKALHAFSGIKLKPYANFSILKTI